MVFSWIALVNDLIFSWKVHWLFICFFNERCIGCLFGLLVAGALVNYLVSSWKVHWLFSSFPLGRCIVFLFGFLVECIGYLFGFLMEGALVIYLVSPCCNGALYATLAEKSN